ncbi:sensor histidine kinase [Asaccharospora irregularis]|uniref:histidine kinase n=1 Tax=Asaccharospora irregularis DSM 2635 TaxID=1121321 RepID=A0A1M5L8I4_9FIRM|nr:sensor histidine kinase [Asaccharospora irregularis]SHG61402.1 Signal transduction histidine kinase [Asaccharospora irregularis DSM 2635]
MSFLEYLSNYIKENRIFLYLIVTIMAIVNIVILLDPYLSKSLESLIYIDLLVCISILIFLVLGFFNYKNKFDMFISYINKKKDEDFNFKGNVIYTEVDKLVKEYDEEIYSLKEELEEINDYMTNWIHEVKIPISVLEIISKRIRDIDTGLSKDIRTSVSRINRLVEQAMYSSRAGNYSSDFLIGETDLENVVKEVIKKNKYQFIYNKIEIETQDLNYTILTDKKWITHIIELIVDNSIKYSKAGGKIEIFTKEAKNGIELHIKDYGLGIVPQDIDRIFDKGFTGQNGRKITKSTGMGLYISKKILNKLSHKIEVISTPGEFCDVYITFYKLSDYFNVT